MNNQTKELHELINDIYPYVDGILCQERLNAKDSKFRKISDLLKDGADVNVKDKDSQSLLCLASYYDQLPLFRYLVENGADIEYADKYGMTPIMHAAEDFYYYAVKILLEHGADPHKCDNDGKTPLMFISNAPDDFYAYAFYYDNFRELFQLFFSKGVDVNAKNKDGETALHYACRYLGRTIEITELLIKNGADVNALNNNGESALMYLCCGLYCHKRKELVQLLIDSGADVSVIDNDGDTALSLINELNSEYEEDELEQYEQINNEIAELLRQHGASK